MSNNITAGKPGRPPKHLSSNVKKGNSSWQPASVLDVLNKEDGFRYRWLNKQPENLAKKQAEGWEAVSGLSSDQALHVDANRVHDGKPMTSIREKHDCILARIPEEVAEQRDAYFNTETQRRTHGLTAHLKKDMQKEGGNAPVHGDITISTRRGEQIIE